MTPAASDLESFRRDGHLLLRGLPSAPPPARAPRHRGSCTAGVRPEGAAHAADGAVTCTAPRGSALLLRPMLHLLFAPPALPLGLQWHHAVWFHSPPRP